MMAEQTNYDQKAEQEDYSDTKRVKKNDGSYGKGESYGDDMKLNKDRRESLNSNDTDAEATNGPAAHTRSKTEKNSEVDAELSPDPQVIDQIAEMEEQGMTVEGDAAPSDLPEPQLPGNEEMEEEAELDTKDYNEDSYNKNTQKKSSNNKDYNDSNASKNTRSNKNKADQNEDQYEAENQKSAPKKNTTEADNKKNSKTDRKAENKETEYKSEKQTQDKQTQDKQTKSTKAEKSKKDDSKKDQSKDKNDSKDQNGGEFKEGDKVAWNYGQGQGEGEVKEVHTKPIEKNIKGSNIKKNGSKDEPAYEIDTNKGSKVLKKGSELEKK